MLTIIPNLSLGTRLINFLFQVHMVLEGPELATGTKC